MIIVSYENISIRISGQLENHIKPFVAISDGIHK